MNRHRSTCEVSAWGAWSECGRIPDDAIIPEDSLGGQQFRERTVVKPKLYNCVEQDCDKELIEFRECEPPTDDEGGNGGDEGGNGGDDGGNGGDDGGNGGDDGGNGGGDGGNGGDDSGNGGDDSDTDSFTDKLKEHWVLIGLGFVGLALLG